MNPEVVLVAGAGVMDLASETKLFLILHYTFKFYTLTQHTVLIKSYVCLWKGRHVNSEHTEC